MSLSCYWSIREQHLAYYHFCSQHVGAPVALPRVREAWKITIIFGPQDMTFNVMVLHWPRQLLRLYQWCLIVALAFPSFFFRSVDTQKHTCIAHTGTCSWLIDLFCMLLSQAKFRSLKQTSCMFSEKLQWYILWN